MNFVVKRDGRSELFDREKIVSAITKAASIDYTDAEDMALVDFAYKIAEEIESIKEDMGVEQIQDRIEKRLMSSRYKIVAKQYILYREARNKARGRKQADLYNEIIATKANDVTRDNANMNADTPAGMMMKFAAETSKPFVDDYLLSEEAKDAVRGNFIHVHDKDYYPTKSLTCVQHPLDKILANGFRAGHGASRPAKRIETAAILAAISMECVQNEQHGGQAIPAFDFMLAPYVKLTWKEEIRRVERITGAHLEAYDEFPLADYYDSFDSLHEELEVKHLLDQARINTISRVHQAMESFIHNMNTIHSRGGNQVVFSSINYGTDTSPEGRLIIKETLESTYSGVGNGETAIFPIQIFKLKDGVSSAPGDPNYDLFKLACKVTARRFFPNFLNLNATYNQNSLWNANDPERWRYEVATMGCRTRVYANRHGVKTSVARGNLSFTTVNLVRIALEADHDINVFFALLDKYCDIAIRQLYDRYLFQCSATAKQFPLLMSGVWLDSDDLKGSDSVKEVLKHGTLSVGFIGLAETLTELIGVHHGESEEAQELGLKIVGYMREKCDAAADAYDLNYTLLATPAEGLAGKFVKKDREDFGEIPGVTDRDFYTNSSHVPVWHKISILDKLRIEAPYHELENAGHIAYIELSGDPANNIEAIEKAVQAMIDLNIGYGSVNHIRNRCLDCGHEDAVKGWDNCPSCGSDNIDIIERITGYLVGSVGRWNSGKKAELNARVSHNTGERIMPESHE